MKSLDKEWVILILQARQLGLTVEEIRTFLNVKEDSKCLNGEKLTNMMRSKLNQT